MMIKALVNGNWEYFSEEELQPGTGSFRFNSGLYETFRTKSYKPVLLKPHLDRLFISAKKINLQIKYSKLEIEKMISKVLDEFHVGDQRARVIIVPEKVIIYTADLNLNRNIYAGVSAITVSAQRNNPAIKTTDYKNCLIAYRLAQSKNCFDAILLDKKEEVCEGSRSNIFWVLNNTLFTREDNVLPGVTRSTIIQNSPYPINFSIINIVDFRRISELFLTNSGSGIIPVIKVNSIIIGNGKPGPMTLNLMKLYDRWSEKSS